MSSYNFDPAGGSPKKDNEWVGWMLIVLLLSSPVWPIGLIFMVYKLLGGKKAKAVPPQAKTAEKTEQPAEKAEKSAPKVGKSAPKAGKTVEKASKAPTVKSSNAKWMRRLGFLAALIGGITLFNAIGTAVVMEWSAYALWDVLRDLAWLLAGLGLLCAGACMDRQARRFQKYLAALCDRDCASIEALARKLGIRERLARKDLERMVERGLFGESAYVDVGSGWLYRSARAEETRAETERAARCAEEKPPQETEEGYSGILRNIRRANDRIADPELSEKIDRLEAITAKIFKAVEENPQRGARISTLLSYYLPTTQKLLDSYAEFESAGVEGENLRQAKERIRATMDAIVQGFAQQLDGLYRVDAMDVDSDIRVMETMLGRDGASAAKDFGLGGGGVQSDTEEKK